jgi:hypothetical protein
MKKMTKIAAFVGASLLASGAHAADWNVSQTADVTVPAPSLSQGATTNVATSNQALNGIALDNTEDDLASGSQTANLASSVGVDLNQGPFVDGSNQAINFIDGQNIGSTSIISQVVNQTDVSTTSLTQSDTSSAGSNVQAANLANASVDVDRLVQDYNETGELEMTQSVMTTSGNVQGVNYAKGVNVATESLSQSIDVDGEARMTQGAGNSGGSNTQVGNGAVATTGELDETVQSFTATTNDLIVTQAVSGTNNVQATNFMKTETGGDIGATAGTTTQTTTIAAGEAIFEQTASASNNIQAGNLASSDGDIADLTQSFLASGAQAVDFDQTPTASSNVQAGNMAVLATGTTDSVDEISQSFVGSNLVTDFNQESASSTLIQAGNLIDITTGNIDDSGTTQSFTVGGGDLSITQNGLGSASGNLQALNAIVDNAGSGSGGTVSQVLNVTAATFSMVQDNITGSGQYGNFVGVKY